MNTGRRHEVAALLHKVAETLTRLAKHEKRASAKPATKYATKFATKFTVNPRALNKIANQRY